MGAWDGLVVGRPRPTDAGLSLALKVTAPVNGLLDLGTAAQQINGSAHFREQQTLSVEPPALQLNPAPLKQALNAWLIDTASIAMSARRGDRDGGAGLQGGLRSGEAAVERRARFGR